MSTFNEDDPKYLHCCGCHISKSFAPTHIVEAILAVVLLYGVHKEHKYCIIAYLIFGILAEIAVVYFLFNHPNQIVDTNIKGNFDAAVSIVIILIILMWLFMLRMFYLYINYLTDKELGTAAQITYQANHDSDPPSYESSMEKVVIHCRN
ncbi:hypothetical protein PFISCL1PPCAC_4301 [Pristionchus fissidentatus]|uniref:Uncharacterized protein n=1 Tax=Pristionchus fissidentatus TaxID=1538716 RepID=A0AAV5V370_9BILA|nr:hypothetical protein PFISCL1PPCAC_4301 [Pristionchus fissidentatus]